MDVLVATDFFTAEVRTLGGLVTYYVLFFLHLGRRKLHGVGVTPHPNEAWMVQVARNVMMEEWGFLAPGPYRIHDRDVTYCPAFQQLMDAAGGHAGPTATAVAESERLRGALGALRQGGVPLTAHPVWGSGAASCLA
jgi:hypothetical protein